MSPVTAQRAAEAAAAAAGAVYIYGTYIYGICIAVRGAVDAVIRRYCEVADRVVCSEYYVEGAILTWSEHNAKSTAKNTVKKTR